MPSSHQHLVLDEWNDGRSNGDSTANGSGNDNTNGASGEEYEIISSNSYKKMMCML